METSVSSFFDTNEIRFNNLVSVDNVEGVALLAGLETDVEKKMKLSNSFIYGEMTNLAKDCPDGSGNATGANCLCTDKMGVMSFGTARGSKQGDILHVRPSTAPCNVSQSNQPHLTCA